MNSLPNPLAKKKKKRQLEFWPKPKAGMRRGPNPKQKLLWIEKMPDSIRPHKHGTDIVLFLGGTRSGKTASAVARALSIAYHYDKAKIIVGSVNFTHLNDTVIEEYKKLLSIRKDWDHPFVLRGPNQNHKRIKFANGSTIMFVNLDQHMKLLGKEADIIHIDEPELLQSSDALETLMTRLSGTNVPFKQVILTANPTENLEWMIEWFSLKQFEEDYAGPPIPIGKPCRCHFCAKCEETTKEDVIYINGMCPTCGHKKDNDCPGNQYFIRVVQSTAADNEHLREGYQRDLNATLSYDKRQQYSKGFVLHRAKGKIYNSFDGQTVFTQDVPIDRDKDLIWTLDFNQHPQCSVICQEYIEDGLTHVAVLDEIVLWGAGPEQVGAEFIRRFKHLDLKGKVHIYGDPSGWTGAIKGLTKDRFTHISEMLEEAGFDVLLHARKGWFPIASRIDSVNWMLKDGNGYRRMKINPSCRHVILGAERIEWDKNGKKEDEKCDHLARKKGKQGELWLMTHPMAALGYFIVAAHPMVPGADPVPYLYNADTGMVTEMKNGEIVERHVSLEDIELEEEVEDELIEEDLEYQEDYGNSSIASLLRSRGSWGMGL